MARWQNCGAPTVSLADALAAISGSRVEYQINTGKSGGSRKRWFVLPPYCPICKPGCLSIPDYYQILKDLAQQEDEEEAIQPECEVLDQGFFEDPSRTESTVERADPYREEGDLFGITPQLLSAPTLFDNMRASDNADVDDLSITDDLLSDSDDSHIVAPALEQSQQAQVKHKSVLSTSRLSDRLECPREIHIEYRLDVIGSDRIIVPGCEPTSALTSATLARWGDGKSGQCSRSNTWIEG